ncbi:hypothetical protein FIBSPDRAFT_69985 [Athelia psychrophila]|uniref:Uncharacterized protein n=1 Tax=Athelia psychrophila TaxID=1759441 RepID=A0A166TT51_9AGAM|nr:hypothetical protein FIBSPDRAFT_69985 [Fibularhizoctonia sp. CBS 109695]
MVSTGKWCLSRSILRFGRAGKARGGKGQPTMHLRDYDYHGFSSTVYLALLVVPQTVIGMLGAQPYTSPVFLRRASQSSCSFTTCRSTHYLQSLTRMSCPPNIHQGDRAVHGHCARRRGHGHTPYHLPPQAIRGDHVGRWRRRPVYIYNWTTIPTDHCHRRDSWNKHLPLASTHRTFLPITNSTLTLWAMWASRFA